MKKDNKNNKHDLLNSIIHNLLNIITSIKYIEKLEDERFHNLMDTMDETNGYKALDNSRKNAKLDKRIEDGVLDIQKDYDLFKNNPINLKDYGYNFDDEINIIEEFINNNNNI